MCPWRGILLSSPHFGHATGGIGGGVERVTSDEHGVPWIWCVAREGQLCGCLGVDVRCVCAAYVCP